MVQNNQQKLENADHEGRKEAFMDIDRMTSEGLGGGYVTMNNGLIEETTTDSMNEPESVLEIAEEEG